MLFSTRGRYALRFMIDLAEHSDKNFVSLKDIADRQGLSEKYLESIIAVMNKAGLVEAARGKGGGYRLKRPAADYTVSEILSAMEGRIAPVACLKEAVNSCEKADECPTLPLWEGLKAVIDDYLSGYTLEDLLNKENAVK